MVYTSITQRFWLQWLNCITTRLRQSDDFEMGIGRNTSELLHGPHANLNVDIKENGNLSERRF